MNIVLVARNQEKLDTIRQEIKKLYPRVEVKTVQFDFNVEYTAEKIAELEDKTRDIQKCSILINNVGAGNFSSFHNMTDENMLKLINVNVTGNVVFTKIFIPKLLANEKRSGLIFIGSSATVSPRPNLAIYSATKSFIIQFSNSIAEEHKDKIDVLGVKTASVKSNMNSGRFWLTILPEQHATAVLAKLGHDVETFGKFLFEPFL